MFIIDAHEVLPPTAAEQLFASDKSSEPVFAGKNPVVSGLDNVCVFVFVVQSVNSDFTNYGVIFIIVPVLFHPSFPFCVCVYMYTV